MPELRAAALIFRHVGGTLGPRASFLLGTGQAGMPMPDHDGRQVFLSFFLYTLILSNHQHAICHFSCTGTHQVAPTLDLNHTDAAAFSGLVGLGIFYIVFALKNGLNRGAVFGRRQVRMVAQTRNINICLTGRFQNRRPGRHFNRLSIDGQIYSIHIQAYSDFGLMFSVYWFQVSVSWQLSSV
jgi:hypothetical protein